jgi:hypothetical protein
MADVPGTVNAPPKTATPLRPESEPADEFTMLPAWPQSTVESVSTGSTELQFSGTFGMGRVHDRRAPML